LKKVTKTAVDKSSENKVDDTSGLNFDFERMQDPHASITDDSLNTLREGTNKYKIDKGDITKSSDTNIFKLITTRYFKTAYPVLVEEDK